MRKRFFKWASQRAFFLALMTALFLLPNFVVPQIATLNPAIHSKELLLRGILGVLVAVFCLAWPHVDKRKLNALEWGIVAFSGVNFLSTLLSATPGFSFVDSFHLSVLPLLSIAIVRLSPDRWRRDAVIGVVIVAAFICAFYGLCVYAGWDFLRTLYPFAYSKGDARNYVHSFLGNPEYFGSYMAPIAVLCFGGALSLHLRSMKSRALWLLFSLFFLFALVLSGSRGAIVGSLLGGAIVGSRALRETSPHLRRRIITGLVVFFAVLSAAVVILSVPNPLNVRRMRLAQRFLSTFDLASDSVRERMLFFCVSGRIVRDAPFFGVGPGCFKLHFYPTVAQLVQEDERAGFRHFAQTLQGRVAEHAHNDYLEIMGETGIIGFAAFAWIMSMIFVYYRKQLKNTRLEFETEQERNIVSHIISQQITLFAALACILFNALFSFPLHLPVRATLFWSLVGLFMASTRDLDVMISTRPELSQSSDVTMAHSCS
jgi:O-antigen ligase